MYDCSDQSDWTEVGWVLPFPCIGLCETQLIKTTAMDGTNIKVILKDTEYLLSR